MELVSLTVGFRMKWSKRKLGVIMFSLALFLYIILLRSGSIFNRLGGYDQGGLGYLGGDLGGFDQGGLGLLIKEETLRFRMKWSKRKLGVIMFSLALFLYIILLRSGSIFNRLGGYDQGGLGYLGGDLGGFDQGGLGLLIKEETLRVEQEGSIHYLDRPPVLDETRKYITPRPTIPSGIKHLNETQSELPDAYVNHMNESCLPRQPILFLKTHKTGSSTLTSILQVYGFHRNLTFAVPKTGAQIISRGFFKTDQVHPGKYDMLVNHARYSRAEMDKVMKPGAKYITIIRDPSTQIESNFGYFFLARYLNLLEEENPFRTFVSNPLYYWNTYKRAPFRSYLRNPNLFDLGLSESEQDNMSIVSKFIDRLAQDFDLVLIQEYFNESLLLLKNLMCWEIDDILYLSKGTRSPRIRFDIEPTLRASIRKWSWADALLYNHFNQTFWKKIQEYGPSFQADLVEFESKLNETLYNCTLQNAPVRDNRRETSFMKNPNGAPKCTDMMRNDVDFTKLLRHIQYGESET